MQTVKCFFSSSWNGSSLSSRLRAVSLTTFQLCTPGSYLEDLKAVDVEDSNVELLLVLLHGLVDALKADTGQTAGQNPDLRQKPSQSVRAAAGTDVNKKVEEPGVQGFGEGVSGEAGLLRVQGDGDGLGLPAPLTVHDPAGEFTAEAVLWDAQQEGRESQD